MSKILIIDDDKDVLFAAEQYLQKNNEDVFTATGGSQGLRVLKQETIDCIVLDVLLKGESGFDLCRKIRSFSSVPIVFLTNLSSQEDLKNGFLMGADDYITKPFSLEELYLRIQARIRQYYQIPSRQKILNFFPLRINLDARTIQIQDNRVPLTMSEFDILVLLAQTPEHVYTISEIYQRVWKMPDMNSTNTVQVHIANLRKKLEEAWADHMFIQTVWGKGYKFVEPPVSG